MEKRRDSSQRSGEFAPKPVEVGKEYDVEIQDISRRAEDIARIQGLVIFVPDLKKGDHARIRITNVARRFAEAEVVEKKETAGKEDR
jgi:predicted RNA-binding protein with TRAM domain